MTGGEIRLNRNSSSYYARSGYRGEACGAMCGGNKITANGNARDYLGSTCAEEKFS